MSIDSLVQSIPGRYESSAPMLPKHPSLWDRIGYYAGKIYMHVDHAIDKINEGFMKTQEHVKNSKLAPFYKYTGITWAVDSIIKGIKWGTEFYRDSSGIGILPGPWQEYFGHRYGYKTPSEMGKFTRRSITQGWLMMGFNFFWGSHAGPLGLLYPISEALDTGSRSIWYAATGKPIGHITYGAGYRTGRGISSLFNKLHKPNYDNFSYYAPTRFASA